MLTIVPYNVLSAKRLWLFHIIFIGVFLLGGCNLEQTGETIDSDYLNARSYKQFKDKILKERKSRAAAKINFRKHIRTLAGQYLGGSNKIDVLPELPNSATIENAQIMAWLDSRKGWRRLNLQNNYVHYPEYAYKPVGKWTGAGHTLMFFLFKKRRVHRHGLLIMISVKMNKISDIKAIASYRKNHNTIVENNVTISSKNIMVKISETIFYPINQADEYQHIYKQQYKIAENGHILLNHAH